MASQLGVEVPEEALAPEPPEPQPLAVVESPEPVRVVAETRAKVSHATETPEAVVEVEAEIIEVDEWDATAEVTEAPQESPDKKRGRRRKRRRKTRRSEEPRRESDLGAGEEATEVEPFVELVEPFEEEGVEELDPEEISEEDQPETIAEESPQKRSKRRRRRRSGRKKTARDDGESGAAASDQTAPPESVDEDLDSEDFDEDSEGDEDVVGREGRGRDKRALHRGIPSWKDAVDVVISANLEARAKRPDRGSGPRGRGGRNRGREKSERNG